MSPLNIVSFMKEHNVPDTAVFNGKDNGYNGWDDIVLSWDIDVPTTSNDKENFKLKRFDSIAWKCVYDSLINNGYKRSGFSSILYREFEYTSVYRMFLNAEYDRLVKYYSFRFTKV